MKQIQAALPTPIGSTADFNEVNMDEYLSVLAYRYCLCNERLKHWLLCRVNWGWNLKNSKALSWKSSFYNLQPQLLQLQFMQLQANSVLVLFSKGRIPRKKTNLLLYRLKWRSKAQRNCR
ncbi:unnamed protein product [Linum trigynum]|uniref:Uncharacterized protein n=1 Tax=Linum trigynum TaxID=586398 RepID=A0AAV2CF02_9ROSI